MITTPLYTHRGNSPCRIEKYFFCLVLLDWAILPCEILAVEGAAPVSVVEAITAPVHEEIPLTGSVTARRVSRISPKVEGFVAEVLVDEGDEVKAAAALLRLDRVMAEIELSRSRAQLEEAKAQFEEAERQRNEAAQLVKKKHIASTDYEAAVAQVNINAAKLQRLQAELIRQKELLSRHTVYAPFNGVVAEKLVEVGQWVNTEMALIELVEVQILRIDVPVPQLYFNQVKIGTSATIKFDALPERIFEGIVTMKIPVGHAAARTFPVRIEMNNLNRILAPGMSARVRLQLKRTGNVILLPRDAIVKKPDGSESVWIVGEEDDGLKAMPVTVKTGRAYRENIEILTGKLKAGDRIVVRGNEILRPGQTVNITDTLAPEL